MKLSGELKFLSAVFLLFCFLTFIIFLPIFFGKVNLNGNLLVSFYSFYGENLPFKNSGWDQLRIYFPFLRITQEAYKNWQFPLWNPYAFSGQVHMADFQTAVFYPLNLAGIFLSQIEFWHLLRLTPTVLASLFAFLYLKSLKLSRLPAVMGALTFGFSPFILTWGEEVVMSPHAVIWLPLILLGVEKYLEGEDKKFLVLIACSSAFSLLAGYMQTTIYLFIFVFSYLVLKLGVRKLFLDIIGLRLLGALIFGVFLAALQLLPSAELFFNAARSQIALKETLFNFLLPLESLATYLAPDFFGSPVTGNFFRQGSAQYYEGILFVGVGALVFAFYSIFYSSKRHSSMVKFLALFGLFATSTTFNLPSAKLFLSLPIPFLSTSIANRILFVPAFCLAVLAAIGAEQWFISGGKKITKVVFGFALVYFLLLIILLAIKFFHLPYFAHGKYTSEANVVVSLRNMAIPLGIFAASGLLIILGTFLPKLKKAVMFLIIIAAAVHIFYFSQKYFSFSDRKYIFPDNGALKFIRENQGIFRSWSVGDLFLENNFASQYGIFWPEGYDSLNNKSYGEFTYAMQGARITDFVFRADAGFGRGKTAELLENPNRRRLVDMLGVKYILASKDDSKVMEKNNFAKVFADENHIVWENLEVMPRVFLASNYEGPPDIIAPPPKSEKEKQERDRQRRKLIFDKLLSEDFDFRNVLVLEKPSPVSPQFGEGNVEVLEYRPLSVVVKTKSDQPKLLFLSDNYYPGWKATVDGDKTPILRANYTFRAVPLTPGEHTVRFYFDSNTFKTGLVISVLSLGALAYLTLRKNPLAG